MRNQRVAQAVRSAAAAMQWLLAGAGGAINRFLRFRIGAEMCTFLGVMDKKKIMKAVFQSLEAELQRQLKGQAMAAEGATHAEAKAETKWDTCGLEQSYLARGLAKQFEKLAGQVDDIRTFKPADYAGRAINVGALIETETDGFKDVFFLLYCGGGIEVQVDGREITVITPESPVGAALMGKKEGKTYSFRAGVKGKILSIQ